MCLHSSEIATKILYAFLISPMLHQSQAHSCIHMYWEMVSNTKNCVNGLLFKDLSELVRIFPCLWRRQIPRFGLDSAPCRSSSTHRRQFWSRTPRCLAFLLPVSFTHVFFLRMTIIFILPSVRTWNLTGFIWLSVDICGRFCGHGNELSSFIKDHECFNSLGFSRACCRDRCLTTVNVVCAWERVNIISLRHWRQPAVWSLCKRSVSQSASLAPHGTKTNPWIRHESGHVDSG